MAEIATIARPYAEALFGVAHSEDLSAIAEQLDALAAVAANPQMRQFADDPKAQGKQIQDVLTSVAGVSLAPMVHNLLGALVDNNRLAAMPEIAQQFRALMSGKTGVSEALVESAFAIDSAQLSQVQATLEKRFGRRLHATVVVDPELIGGIRVVVGDEVLDTSVKARLEQMKVALA